MSFIDFIKNRQSQQPSSAPAVQPETAKQMYSREAAQEKSSRLSPGNLSPDQQAKVAEAKSLFRQGTEQATDGRVAAPAAPTEGASSQQPMVQMSMNQDAAAPALSPTSAQKGARSNEPQTPSVSKDVSGKSKEQAKPTISRPTPSWER